MDEATRKALELYGPGIASFMGHPEIGAIIHQAAEAGETADVVIGRLRSTDWWLRTQDSNRQWQVLEAEDPAEAQRRIAAGVQSLIGVASTMGIALTPEQAEQVAADSLRFGWTEEETRLVLVNHHDWDQAAAAAPGQMGDAIRRARSHADAYMVPVSDQTLNGLARQWMSGHLDEAGVRSYMEQQARIRWGNNASIISGLDRGLTVAQLTDPLRERIAQTLEISPAQVDLRDSYWSQALNVDDGSGQARMMNDYEIMQHARRHDDFDATGTAIRQANELANSLIETFGGR